MTKKIDASFEHLRLSDGKTVHAKCFYKNIKYGSILDLFRNQKAFLVFSWNA